MSIILFSGTVDKMMAASVMASGGVMMGMNVDIFFTYYGLNSLLKENVGTNNRFSKDFDELAGPMMAMMQLKHMPSWYDTLKQAKEMGNVKVHGCTMTAELMGQKKENYDPIIDDMVGVATFVDTAQNSQVTLFI
jgi:peroxiredoxin family protein